MHTQRVSWSTRPARLSREARWNIREAPEGVIWPEGSGRKVSFVWFMRGPGSWAPEGGMVGRERFKTAVPSSEEEGWRRAPPKMAP